MIFDDKSNNIHRRSYYKRDRVHVLYKSCITIGEQVLLDCRQVKRRVQTMRGIISKESSA